MALDFLSILQERGFIHQCSNLEALQNLFQQERVTAYIGFDATADSLHVGSLVQIMMLRWLQKCGHKPVILMGGGTSKVGDPSFKATERPLLTEDLIEKNIAGITKVFSHFVSFDDGETGAIMANNNDWLSTLSYIPFLRDFGRHFSVNRMLSFDSVKIRLDREQSLSFLEFNYMILQAYDFWELYKRYGCRLQMGGSDQWGNIINGVELTRRCGGKEVFALTSPLVTTASGEKMGKTAQGAVWLNKERLAPYDYWQFWRNTEDADVGRYLRLFTELPLEEIAKLEALTGAEINEAKKILADEATTLAHGRQCLEGIHQTIRSLFEKKDHEDLSSLPAYWITPEALGQGMGVVDALCLLGFSKSKSEARRLIQGKGARVNDIPVEDIHALLTLEHFDEKGMIKISASKKTHGVLRLHD